jgi:hypothetical protein
MEMWIILKEMNQAQNANMAGFSFCGKSRLAMWMRIIMDRSLKGSLSGVSVGGGGGKVRVLMCEESRSKLPYT